MNKLFADLWKLKLKLVLRIVLISDFWNPKSDWPQIQLIIHYSESYTFFYEISQRDPNKRSVSLV